MILSLNGIISGKGSIPITDVDVLAFISAASITDNTQKSAINQLVLDLKAANIWTKMKALYPFVGGNATGHKFNLKDPRDVDAAYRLVFSGGWTHSSNGILPNGTTAFADTKIAPTAMGQNNVHVSVYLRTNIDGLYDDISGGNAGTSYILIMSKNATDTRVVVNTINADPYSNTSSTGMYIANRIVAGTVSLFKNNTKVINAGRASQTRSSFNLYLGARNNGGTAVNFSPREQAFASIGDGLTDAEALSFYNAVHTFNTTLNRQVI